MYSIEAKIAKVGNLLNYISAKCPWLYLTKALKLLYIIDETSISETGTPVTWLEYKVWKMGPVSLDVYNDVKNQRELFNKKVKYTDVFNVNWANPGVLISPIGEFEDDEFSDYEISLIDRIINEHKKDNSDALIRFLHKEDSLWSQEVKRNNLKAHFKSHNTSTVVIDLTKKIKEDPFKLELYQTSSQMLSL